MFRNFAIAATATLISTGAMAQVWQVEPLGEGSAETYVYTAPGGTFISYSANALWIVYGLRAPRADGTCTFDSCGIGVRIDGQAHHGQDSVTFSFSDGTEVPITHPGFPYVVSDAARVNWPIMHDLITGLKSNAWVEVTYADGRSHRFSLAGSAAAIERGAATQAGQ